jgi:hypothetical protein
VFYAPCCCSVVASSSHLVPFPFTLTLTLTLTLATHTTLFCAEIWIQHTGSAPGHTVSAQIADTTLAWQQAVMQQVRRACHCRAKGFEDTQHSSACLPLRPCTFHPRHHISEFQHGPFVQPAPTHTLFRFIRVRCAIVTSACGVHTHGRPSAGFEPVTVSACDACVGFMRSQEDAPAKQSPSITTPSLSSQRYLSCITLSTLPPQRHHSHCHATSLTTPRHTRHQFLERLKTVRCATRSFLAVPPSHASSHHVLRLLFCATQARGLCRGHHRRRVRVHPNQDLRNTATDGRHTSQLGGRVAGSRQDAPHARDCCRQGGAAGGERCRRDTRTRQHSYTWCVASSMISLFEPHARTRAHAHTSRRLSAAINVSSCISQKHFFFSLHPLASGSHCDA